MVTPGFVSEPLSERHHLDAFECGKAPLDEWLVRSARHAEANRSARTFVWHRGDHVVVAYFSLAASLIRREGLPAKLGRGSPDTIPAVLLARLALVRSLHGGGVGSELLIDALTRTVAATALLGARMLVVDAIDEDAVRFYERYGFIRVPTQMRLAQKVSAIAAAVVSTPADSKPR